MTEGPLAAPSVGLRTHTAIALGLLLLVGAGSAAVYWQRTEVEKRIERDFAQDLRILTLSPRLRTSIRLGNRRDAVDILARMAEGAHNPAVADTLAALQARLSPTSGDDAELYPLVTSLDRAAAEELERAKETMELSSSHRFVIRTLLELIGTLVIGWYLFTFIVSPVLELEDAVRRWKLGEPWNAVPSRAIPEIRSLANLFAENARALNAQYDLEKRHNEFKTKLVSLISHEFGNAIAVIRNAIFLIEERASPQDAKVNGQFYRVINASTNMLGSAVSNLLTINRLEAGQLAINLTRTDCAEILRDTTERLGLLAEAKQIKLILELTEPFVPVLADAATLGLVVSNLVSNAIKYTPDHGRIVVGAGRQAGKPGWCRVYVEDTGIGIAAEDQPRVLLGHYRTRDARKMTLRGFGIGLSLARQIVEAHGSALELKSAPGKGSRFSFLLPAAGEPKP